MLSRVYPVLLQCLSPVLLRCVSGVSQVLPRCCRVRLSNHRLEPGRPGLQGLTLGLTCGMLTVAHAAWQPEEAAATCAPARRWRMRACCGRACAAFTARLKHAARRSSTAEARQRSCQQTAKPLQSALQLSIEVIVGLAAARDARISTSLGRTVPYSARHARSRRCDVHTSACRCQNVLMSCLCRLMVMCC